MHYEIELTIPWKAVNLKVGLATHVERKNRYLVAGKVVDKRSETFMLTSIALFKAVDSRLFKTFTVDNGSEFAQFKTLEKAKASKVDFAEPLGNAV